MKKVMKKGLDLDGVLVEMVDVKRLEGMNDMEKLEEFERMKKKYDVREFIKEGKVIVVTGREEWMKEMSYRQLRKYNEGIEIEIICVGYNKDSYVMDKVNKLKELGIEEYWDDNEEMVEILNREGIKAWLVK